MAHWSPAGLAAGLVHDRGRRGVAELTARAAIRALVIR
jgi:hypothetical protein